jgi:hypothetical protein
MRTFLLACCLLPTILLAQPKGSLQRSYLSYLQGAGYQAYIDRDGDVQFQAGNLSFFLSVDPQDPLFFRLVLPNFWPIESQREYDRALRACTQTNRQVKSAKLYLQNNNVWLTVENFMVRSDDFHHYFDRCLAAAELCLTTFRQEMQR